MTKKVAFGVKLAAVAVTRISGSRNARLKAVASGSSG